MTLSSKLIELGGWCGAFTLIIAYFLVSFRVLRGESVWYQLLNISGATGIILVSWARKNYQPMLLNIMWVLIGIIALGKLLV